MERSRQSTDPVLRDPQSSLLPGIHLFQYRAGSPVLFPLDLHFQLSLPRLLVLAELLVSQKLD